MDPLKFAWTRFTSNPAFYLAFGGITLIAFPLASQMTSAMVVFFFTTIGDSVESGDAFSLLGQFLGSLLSILIGCLSAPFYATFFVGMKTEQDGANCPVSRLFDIVAYFLDALLICVLTGLLVFIGFLFCILPGIVLAPLIPISYIYQARGASGLTAIGKAFKLVQAQPSVLLHSLGYMVLGILGVLLCCVGQVATLPIAYAAIYKAVCDADLAMA